MKSPSLTCSTVARSAFSVVLVFPMAKSRTLLRIAVVTELDMPTFILPSHSCTTKYYLKTRTNKHTPQNPQRIQSPIWVYLVTS